MGALPPMIKVPVVTYQTYLEYRIEGDLPRTSSHVQHSREEPLFDGMYPITLAEALHAAFAQRLPRHLEVSASFSYGSYTLSIRVNGASGRDAVDAGAGAAYAVHSALLGSAHVLPPDWHALLERVARRGPFYANTAQVKS